MSDLGNAPSGYVKSALFVDFDNIFIGLQQTDPRAAERFAREPLSWIEWLERSVAVPDGDDGTAGGRKRRLLVRRCYLNPRSFNRFRAFFIRSGFEVIDTPPLTSQGKTSADVHMVLDLVDSLHHPTRFDEFIVFSGDADFTPLLLRLRKHDRRSLVLAVGYASSAYKAACDVLIDQETFVEEALGIEAAPDVPPGGELPGAPRPSAEESAERAEVLGRIGRRMREVVAMMGAVGAADVPQVYKEFPEFTSGENWLDFFSLRRMTEAVVEAAGDLEIVGEDAWRVQPKRAAAPPEGEPAEPAPAPRFEEIRDFVVRTVRASAGPVVLGAMAHEVVRRFGDEVKEHDWQYAGSFKAFLERLGLDGIAIAPKIPGHLYDPAVHGDFDPGDRVDPFAVRHPEIAELARAVSDVTDTPYLTPGQYAVVFSEVAKEAEENGFQLTRTSKAVRDRCNGKGISVARTHISFLLKGLSFSGFRFTGDGETAERIGRTIYRNTLELCRRAQMDLSPADERRIADWLLGGLGEEVAASAAQSAAATGEAGAAGASEEEGAVALSSATQSPQPEVPT